MRAGTTDQDATRFQQPEGALIDLAIPALRPFQVASRLRKRRRIEYYGIESTLCMGVGGEHVEDIGLPESNIANIIGSAVDFGRRQGCRRTIDGFHRTAVLRQMKSKATIEGEAIECFAVGI